MNKVGLLVTAVVLLGVGLYYFLSPRVQILPAPVAGERVYCTQEAKLCPDGSSVGRIAPDCEFAVCTETAPVAAEKSGITGSVSLGPTCPVMRNPPDPGCADKPYQAMLALTTLDSTHVIKTFSADLNGKFKVDVAPGQYAIVSASTNVLPRCTSSETIIVTANSYTTTTVTCDTGIR